MKINFTKKRTQNIIFLSLLVFISLLYGYHKSIVKGPYSIHQWRQVDGLSYAQNFHKGDASFFESEVHWLSEEGNGKTVSEFPIIYYLVSILWTIFGKSHIWLRVINVLLVYIGLFSLFKISMDLVKSFFWACFIPIFLFTSPILIYYGNNFLMNAPAFGLALTGASLLIRYFFIKNKQKYLYWGVFVFVLAGLLKVTALISLVAILAVWLINIISKQKIFKFKNENNKYRIIETIAFLFITIIVFIWYKYTSSYNAQNISGMFLQDIFPIWDLDKEAINDILLNLYHNLVPYYFNITALSVIFGLFVSLFFMKKYISKYMFAIVIITLIGIILFMLLWFKAFTVHDYYMINLLIFIPFVLLTFITALSKTKMSFLLYNRKFKIFTCIALAFLIYNSAIKTRIRYDANQFWVKHSVIVEKSNIDYWKWYHWNYTTTYKALESITPYLRSLNIEREDRVISIPDQSPNITLYLMDQRGYTDFGYSGYQGKERIEHFISLGAKYLIINDASFLEKDYLKSFQRKRIGVYENVQIFDLREI
jgi:hypothetical protein